MVTDDRKDKALRYLAETDLDCARAKTLLKGLEDTKKSVFATIYLQYKEGSQKDREMKALCHDDYIAHLTKINQARMDYEHMNEKRHTECEVLNVWRSENANRRQGPYPS